MATEPNDSEPLEMTRPSGQTAGTLATAPIGVHPDSCGGLADRGRKTPPFYGRSPVFILIMLAGLLAAVVLPQVGVISYPAGNWISAVFILLGVIDRALREASAMPPA